MAGALVAWFLLRHRSVPTDESQLALTLVTARERRPLLSPAEAAFVSGDFMIVQQHATQANILQPISEQLTDPQLIEQDCGTLTVTVGADRAVSLNSETVGTLNDTAPLSSKLSALFQDRIAQRAYRPGFESRTDLPMLERIPRTVLLRPSRSLRYGDVLQLIELLKESHGDPIGLQIAHLPT